MRGLQEATTGSEPGRNCGSPQAERPYEITIRIEVLAESEDAAIVKATDDIRVYYEIVDVRY